MSRSAQSAAFAAALASDGMETRLLLDVTLADDSVLHLSDAPITLEAEDIVYEPDLRDVGDWRASQGGNVDGMRFGVQNVDSTYSTLTPEGAALLDGAKVVVRYAVRKPEDTDWQVDTITEGLMQDFSGITQESAPFNVIPDYANANNLVSGELVTLPDLTPTATSTISSGGPTGGGTGYRDNGYLDWLRDRRFDLDHQMLPY